jgi:hypothetical protein
MRDKHLNESAVLVLANMADDTTHTGTTENVTKSKICFITEFKS